LQPRTDVGKEQSCEEQSSVSIAQRTEHASGFCLA